jgi:hypothetical protein
MDVLAYTWLGGGEQQKNVVFFTYFGSVVHMPTRIGAYRGVGEVRLYSYKVSA